LKDWKDLMDNPLAKDKAIRGGASTPSRHKAVRDHARALAQTIDHRLDG
jgi:hypothetical protein